MGRRCVLFLLVLLPCTGRQRRNEAAPECTGLSGGFPECQSPCLRQQQNRLKDFRKNLAAAFDIKSSIDDWIAAIQELLCMTKTQQSGVAQLAYNFLSRGFATETQRLRLRAPLFT